MTTNGDFYFECVQRWVLEIEEVLAIQGGRWGGFKVGPLDGGCMGGLAKHEIT